MCYNVWQKTLKITERVFTMAKDKKVEQITDMELDFGQWFTDVCKKAQLIDYSSIKGVFIYRPYGYAIWENIQHHLDKEFKKQGVENVYMPLLIPESLLQKEKDHVEGFAGRHLPLLWRRLRQGLRHRVYR